MVRIEVKSNHFLIQPWANVWLPWNWIINYLEKLYINLMKCISMTPRMILLWLIMLGVGILINQGKGQTIRYWIDLIIVHEVRNFHGLTSFYGMFNWGFNIIVAIIIDCLKYLTKWNSYILNVKTLKKHVIAWDMVLICMILIIYWKVNFYFEGWNCVLLILPHYFLIEGLPYGWFTSPFGRNKALVMFKNCFH